jgi:hypothetical protein
MALKTSIIRMNLALTNITQEDTDIQPKEIKSTPKSQVKSIKDSLSLLF